ncbi:hypothetical protein BDQ17DRAFT_1348043 [Cyathus striatus]|nr:hypothetical protein BDQ17DRAFT_1348043 [Cyathus striatus]
MVHSSLLDFDPFAVHPFTNISAVVPQSSQQMPHPIPIPPHKHSYYPSSSPGSTSSSPSSVSTQGSIVLHSPAPRRRAPDAPTSQPIFVPYRREASSPDLVLKKKSPSQSIASYPSRTSKA